MNPTLNQYEIENYVQTTAKRANLRVVWNDKNEVATDGTNVYLPRINSMTSEKDVEDMLAFVAHEVSHVLYSDFDVLKNKAIDSKNSFLGAIHNGIEDDGIDAINAREFLGDKQMRTANVSRTLERIVENVKMAKAKNGGALPPEMEQMASLLSWNVEGRSDYYAGIGKYADEIAAELGEKGQEYLKKLRDGNYYHRVKALREDESKNRTAAAYDLSKDIFREVYEQDPEEEEKKNKARQKAQEEAEGKGKGEGAGKGAGEGDGDGEEEGEGKPRKAKQGKGKGERVDAESEFDYTPFNVDQHEEFVPGKRKHGQKVNYAKYKEDDRHGTYVPTPKEQVIVVDYVTGKSNYGSIRPGEDSATPDESITEDSGFSNQVRRLLQIRSRSKVQYGVKRGSIHPSNSYRVVLKNAPGYNERVFKRVIPADVLDTAVFWLGDISGSMSGSKFRALMSASCKINGAIGNALRIPLEITGFTEHSCRNAMFVWRKFDTQLLSNEVLARRMEHSSSYMSQNCDGDSIVYAYNRLKQRKEKRKLLIVASDGSPASSKGGDIYKYTRNVVRAIEKDKSVDVYAIGIMDNNVERIYQQHRVISRASELEQALLSIIEKKIV